MQQESSRDGAEPNIQHCPTLNESLDRVVQLKAWSQRSTSMLVSSPIPSAQYASLLTVDRVRAVLDACGYRSAAVLLAGTHSLSPGCTVALQFGDQIAMSGGGATRLTIRCSLQINGVDDRIDGATVATSCLPGTGLTPRGRTRLNPDDAEAFLLFAFDIGRALDVLVDQLSQRYLRFAVTDSVSVPPTLGGLISQMDGAF